MSRKEDVQKLIVNYKRRLQKRKEQRASLGLDAPPYILTEIEDIEAEIKELQTELETLKDNGVDEGPQRALSELAEGTHPKQRVQIYLQGDLDSLSADRRSVAIDAFAAVMGISPQEIEVYRVYQGSIVFDLGIPFNATQRLRSLLQSNRGQLCLLRIEKVILEGEAGQIEEWVVKEGKFDVVTSTCSTTPSDVRGEPLKAISHSEHRDQRARKFFRVPPIIDEIAAGKAQIFLSYARQDEEKVEKLYQKLSNAGFKPWMDKKDILPGENWKFSIQQAIRRSDFFLACLSANSVNKRGWIQREIREALDILQGMLDNDIYLIPVRLQDCEVPESLYGFQWVNLFEEDGWTQLMKAIQIGMERRAEVPPGQVQEQIIDPHLEAHWAEVQRLVRTARRSEVIPLLKHIRDTAPLYRSGEVEALLEKAREWQMKRRRWRDDL